MNAFRRIFIILSVVVVLAALVVPTFAQGTTTTRTIIVTEEQINASYWVTNPVRRSVSNVHVDLQAGQVVVSATFTYRRIEPFEGEAVLVPSVENGRVYWSAVSATGSEPRVPQKRTRTFRRWWRRAARPARRCGPAAR